MHVDDLADACVSLMEQDHPPTITNVGVGADLTIAELAELISDVVDFEGEIIFDASKPDGTPRKLLDVHRLTATGWRPRITLREGLKETYGWFVEQVGQAPAQR
jgi:GDP-L-fucose synthase